MTGPAIELPPDVQGHLAALETQDSELTYTWAAIRDTVYGMLASIGDMANALAAGNPETALEHADNAVNLGYAFAWGEFQDICKAHGLDPSDPTYDSFIDARIEHALEDPEETENADGR